MAAENPAKAGELLADLRAWRERVGAQMPTPNPAYDPARADEGEAKEKKPKKDKAPNVKKAKGR